MEMEKQMFDKQISTKYFLNKYLLGMQREWDTEWTLKSRLC